MISSIAVVGASLAGITAVEALRQRGFDGAITLIGDESEAPYDRPPLSKQALRADVADVVHSLRASDEIADLGVDLCLGTPARHLRQRVGPLHVIELADGRVITVDRVIAATGARARTLPFAEPQAGVFVLRTHADAAAIKSAFDAARNVVVIGAGFLGLEVASSARARGLEVTVLEAGAAPLGRSLGTRLGNWATDLHRQRGVDIRCRMEVAGFVGHDRLEAVALRSGELIPADVAVIAVGSIPNAEWLMDSGAIIDNGVVCDLYGRSSVDGVFAAGDVANYRSSPSSTSRRSEHWSSAIAQARLVAANLLADDGQLEPLKVVPYFWSDQYDAKLQVVGECHPDQDCEIVEGSVESGVFGVVFRTHGVVEAAAAVNMPQFVASYRRQLKNGAHNASKEISS